MKSLIADILVKALPSLSPGDQNTLVKELTRLENTTKDIGSRIGGGGGVTTLHSGNVELNYSVGLVVYNPVNGAVTIQLESDGDLKAGSNLALPAETSIGVFSNDQMYNNELMGAGDLLLGDNTAGASNLFWDRSAGTLNLRAGTTNSIILGTDGVLTLSNALRSMNWSLGVSGFNIDAITGNAEFNDITARGSFTSSVFVKGLIEAHAGTLVVAKSAAVLAVDMVVPTSGTWYMFVERPPGSGFLFSSGDYINAREYFSTTLVSLWFTVGSGVDMGDGTTRYLCTYVSGDRTSQRTYTKGLATTDYGSSGQGYLQMSADETFGSPYYSVRTWSGTPSTVTERVRIGNMYGTYGTGSNNRYGIGIGDYSGGYYLSYNAESANGLVLKVGSGAFSVDSTNGVIFHGSNIQTDLSTIKFYASAGSYTNRDCGDIYPLVDITYDRKYLVVSGNQYTRVYSQYGTISMGQQTSLRDEGEVSIQGGTPSNSYINVSSVGFETSSHTRIGGGLYVGSTATAPTTGCVHIPSGSLMGTTTASMTKDTAISFTPVNNQGMILVWRRSLTVALTVWGLVYYNAGSTAFTAIASGGANLEVTTGALTGTTGTDTKVTVSAHTDGKIYIENRVITGLTLHYVLLGG
jgi:hypothetical protein